MRLSDALGSTYAQSLEQTESSWGKQAYSVLFPCLAQPTNISVEPWTQRYKIPSTHDQCKPLSMAGCQANQRPYSSHEGLFCMGVSKTLNMLEFIRDLNEVSTWAQKEVKRGFMARVIRQGRVHAHNASQKYNFLSMYRGSSNIIFFWFLLNLVKGLMLKSWLKLSYFEKSNMFYVQILKDQMFCWKWLFPFSLTWSIYISVTTAWIMEAQWLNSNFKYIFLLYKMNSWTHFVLMLWNAWSKIT